LVFQSKDDSTDKTDSINAQSFLAVISYEDTFSFDGERCFFSKRKVNVDFLKENNDE